MAAHFRIFTTAILALHTATGAIAQSVNAGDRAASDARPFESLDVAQFNTPWALAFLPDGRMLVTEKPGAVYLVTQDGGENRGDGRA